MNATAKMNERTNEQTNQQTNQQTSEQASERKSEQKSWRASSEQTPAGRSFEWIPEALALVIVTPALVHGVMSLQNLPIV